MERAWQKGARFDGWSETFSLSLWLDAFQECGLNPADYTRERQRQEPLPWDHITVGVTRDFLWRERERAYDARLTPDCRTGCSVCGVNCVEATALFMVRGKEGGVIGSCASD